MRFRKAAAVHADRIDENIVIINNVTLKCFLLNDMAAIIWDALDEFPERDDLVSLLAEAEVVEPARTLDGLTDQLLELGLLEAMIE
jgi:hypothetical protein